MGWTNSHLHCFEIGDERYGIEALADPAHTEHGELTRWIGGPFDPRRFDVAEVNVELQRLARS